MQGLLLTSLVLSVYCYSIVAIEPWKKIDVTGTKPSGLWHTLTFRNGTSMLLFGGGIKRKKVWSFYNDLWRINLLSEKPKWEIVIPDGQAASPPKRFGSAGVKLGNKMYMFGGYNKDHGRFNDLWSFDLVTASWSRLIAHDISSSPPARNAHSAVLRGNIMYVFGGYLNGKLNDLWAIDLSATPLSWSSITANGASGSPSKRDEPAAVLFGDKMYVFGGAPSNSRSNELYEIDLSSSQPAWTKLYPTGQY